MKTDNRELLKDCLPWVVLGVGLAAFCWLMYLGNRPGEKPEKRNVMIAVGNEPFNPNTAPRFETIAEANRALSASNYVHTNSILDDAGFKADTDERLGEWWANAPTNNSRRLWSTEEWWRSHGEMTRTLVIDDVPIIVIEIHNTNIESITLYITNLAALSNRLTIY